MIKRTLIFISLFLVLIFKTEAQKDTLRIDTVKPVKNNKAIYSKARKATIMSVILPGLGQVYNKKYWKVPIIYAGLGGFGYMFYNNNNQYNYFRKNVIAFYKGDSSVIATTKYSPDQLQTEKVYYKKYRDFAIIGMGIFYLINIIDANVDAHLKTFDVSDDLSINIDPWQTIVPGGKCVTGLSIKLNFK